MLGMPEEITQFGKEIGLIHEILLAGRKFGMRREDWVKLLNPEEMLELMRVIRDTGDSNSFERTKPSPHCMPPGFNKWVDPDMNPASNRVGGIDLHTASFVSRRGTMMNLKDFLAYIRGKYKLKNLLNYFDAVDILQNQEVVPEEFRGKRVFLLVSMFHNEFNEQVQLPCLDINKNGSCEINCVRANSLAFVSKHASQEDVGTIVLV
jgi:hypothetical protein